MRTPEPWEHTFMSMAIELAERSKDPSTQVGCVITRHHEMLGFGYNGPPSRMDDGEVPWEERDVRPTKYDFIIHAEENAWLRALVKGPLNDTTLWTSGVICSACALRAAALGVTTFVCNRSTVPRMCDATDQYVMREVLRAMGATYIEMGLEERGSSHKFHRIVIEPPYPSSSKTA